MNEQQSPKSSGSTRYPRAKPLPMFATAVLIAAALYGATLLPPTPATAVVEDESAPHAVAAAKAFIESLDEKQREQAVYQFGSPDKSRWSNLPVRMVPRNGVRLGDLNKTQRGLAMEAVASVLSKEGYQKIVDIMDGDQRLADEEGRGGPDGMFGSDLYYLAFFGKIGRAHV